MSKINDVADYVNDVDCANCTDCDDLCREVVELRNENLALRIKISILERKALSLNCTCSCHLIDESRDELSDKSRDESRDTSRSKAKDSCECYYMHNNINYKHKVDVESDAVAIESIQDTNLMSTYTNDNGIHLNCDTCHLPLLTLRCVERCTDCDGLICEGCTNDSLKIEFGTFDGASKYVKNIQGVKNIQDVKNNQSTEATNDIICPKCVKKCDLCSSPTHLLDDMKLCYLCDTAFCSLCSRLLIEINNDDSLNICIDCSG